MASRKQSYLIGFMPSHIHFIFRSANEQPMELLRNFKKHTAKKVIDKNLSSCKELHKKAEEKPNEVVRRSQWLLEYFNKACQHLKRKQTYKVWQDGYHPEICSSNKFILQKLNYIHNNPVIDKIVANPEDYVFSSARNYADLEFELEVVVLNVF